MSKLLTMVIIWAISSALVRIMSAIGIGFLTYQGLEALVAQLVATLQPAVTSLPVQVVSLLGIAGVGEALSIVVGAVLTRAAFNSAKVFLGVAS